MFNFVSKGVRGGLSYICHRKAEAGPGCEIKYFDANNLYGCAMMRPLPVGGFQWIDPKIWADPFGSLSGSFDDVMKLLDASTINYFLEVDAVFPRAVHEKMADFPFLPEPFIPPGSTTPKLVNHLGPRMRYVLSYEMFILARQHGVEFPVIHRILQYNQAPWLKSYMDYNTEKRKNASTDFEKDYFKLMNNACFGKLLEDVTKYTDFELFTNAKLGKFQKLHRRKPYLIRQDKMYHQCENHAGAFDGDDDQDCCDDDSCVVGMVKEKRSVRFDKPIIVGMKVLELAKVIMYDLYYNYLQPNLNMKLCMTDTDSFVLKIVTKDLNSDLKKLYDCFDFSNYSPDHVLFSDKNKRVPGKLKDEYPGQRIEQFIGLRAKCYAFTCEDESTVHRAKGVKKNVPLCMNDYDSVLSTGEPKICTQLAFRSYNQSIYSVKQNKIALSRNDDKRVICDDGMSTLPWGHFKLK